MKPAPVFDAALFAVELGQAIAGRPLRTIAEQAGVSASTVSRALNGWPDLSRLSWLRLTAWIAAQRVQERAAA